MTSTSLQTDPTHGTGESRVVLIEGGVPLRGDVTISGSKNAALPMLAACLLTRQECTLSNVPNLSDVRVMVKLLTALGAEVDFDQDEGRITVNACHLSSTEAPFELVVSMRASFLVAGPLLARERSFRTSLPGGCSLGARPVDAG